MIKNTASHWLIPSPRPWPIQGSPDSTCPFNFIHHFNIFSGISSSEQSLPWSQECRRSLGPDVVIQHHWAHRGPLRCIALHACHMSSCDDVKDSVLQCDVLKLKIGMSHSKVGMHHPVMTCCETCCECYAVVPCCSHSRVKCKSRFPKLKGSGQIWQNCQLRSQRSNGTALCRSCRERASRGGSMSHEQMDSSSAIHWRWHQHFFTVAVRCLGQGSHLHQLPAQAGNLSNILDGNWEHPLSSRHWYSLWIGPVLITFYQFGLQNSHHVFRGSNLQLFPAAGLSSGCFGTASFVLRLCRVVWKIAHFCVDFSRF